MYVMYVCTCLYVCIYIYIYIYIYSIFSKTIQHLTSTMESYVTNNFDMLGLLLIIKVWCSSSSSIYMCIYVYVNYLYTYIYIYIYTGDTYTKTSNAAKTYTSIG